MVTLLTSIYVGLVFLLFKFKILKVRPYPIAWAAVGGVLVVGGIVATWMLCAPLSPKVVAFQYVVQLVPYVKGQVLKIHAKANQPVKKGDLLLEINPAPSQFTVNQLESQLAATKSNIELSQAALQAAAANAKKASSGISQAQAAISQAKAAKASAVAGVAKAKSGFKNAQAGVDKAMASLDLAKTEEQIALNLQKADAGAISTLKVTQAVQNRQANDAAAKQAQLSVDDAQDGIYQADAGVNQANASILETEAALGQAEAAKQQADAAHRQAEFALRMAKDGVPTIQAQLDDALFNLAQCRMTAPDDGYVVDWVVQDGSMVVPYTAASAGTFVKTTETDILAVYPQNYLMNVVPGNDVELILDPYPGRLFKGKVDYVIPATGEGEFLPSKQMPYAAKIGSYGVLAVRIHLDDDDRSTPVPLGAGGTVAIYTDYGKPVHVISKVTIRIKKWMLYVLPSVSKP